MWFRRKVISGDKVGRKLGHPTLNFHIGSFADYHEPGVYSCQLRIAGKMYKGALFYGPKLSGKEVLEVFVLGFSKNIYGQMVSFQIGNKLRPPKKFPSFAELKKQIQKDIESVV